MDSSLLSNPQALPDLFFFSGPYDLQAQLLLELGLSVSSVANHRLLLERYSAFLFCAYLVPCAGM